MKESVHNFWLVVQLLTEATHERFFRGYYVFDMRGNESERE